MSVDLRILGSLEVRDRGARLVPRRRLARVLLGALALRPNVPAPVEWIVDALWNGTPPRSAAANIRSYVAELRGLGPHIDSSGGGYTLVADPAGLDALRFDGYLAEGRRARAAGLPDLAAERLGLACGLWRGPLLDGTAIPNAVAGAAATLEDRRLDALEEWVEARMALGRHAELATELAGLTAAHGLRERLWRQRMRTLWSCGRPAEALAAYEHLTLLLAQELGATPSDTTRALAERIRRGGPAREVSAPMLAPRPHQLPADVGPFLGRQDELAALDARAGAGGLCVVTGTAGVGKTALAVHWSHWAADHYPDGCLYADLSGYGPREPIPPARILADLLRGLGVRPADGGLDRLAARYRSLLHGRRMLIVLDNARSAAQVRPLLPGWPGCLTLVTSRDALAGLVARDGARRIALGPLCPNDAIALLRALIGARAAAEPEAIAALAECGARLPLTLRLTAELAASRPTASLSDLAAELADASDRLDAFDAGGDASTAVRTVFSWSYRSLPPPVARAFRLLGLHPGRDFDAPALAAAAAIPVRESARALAALTAANLVEPAAPGRSTMHDLLRAYARETAERTDPDDDRAAAVSRLSDHYLARGDQ